MSFPIDNNVSLLQSVLAQETARRPEQSSQARERGFAERLDSILGPDTDNHPEQDRAQAAAEVLQLQMLHSTLALAGDHPAEQSLSPLTLPGSAAAVLARTYAANQAEQPAAALSTIPTDTTAAAPAAPIQAPHVSAAAPSTALSRETQWLEPIIAKASRRYGVDASLIKSVIKAESNFNPSAVSPAGARGLMQLMPATARSLGVTDSFDPEQNVMAGTRFLKDLLNRYNGDLDSALAAYNWGPGNVDRKPDRLPRETRDYLVRVKQLYNSYSA